MLAAGIGDHYDVAFYKRKFNTKEPQGGFINDEKVYEWCNCRRHSSARLTVTVVHLN